MFSVLWPDLVHMATSKEFLEQLIMTYNHGLLLDCIRPHTSLSMKGFKEVAVAYCSSCSAQDHACSISAIKTGSTWKYNNPSHSWKDGEKYQSWVHKNLLNSINIFTEKAINSQNMKQHKTNILNLPGPIQVQSNQTTERE